jgi:hypothetical protein
MRWSSNGPAKHFASSAQCRLRRPASGRFTRFFRLERSPALSGSAAAAPRANIDKHKPAKTESMAHVVTGRRAFLKSGVIGFGAALFSGAPIVRITAPVEQRASLTIEACRAGMDVWVEAPVCRSLEDGMRMVEAARRYGRVVQAGTFMRSGASWQNARDTVRCGELGKISFVRMTGRRRVHMIDAVQFAFGEVEPLSVTTQSNGPGRIRLATFRYPGFVASWEQGTAETVSFHGSHATLSVGCEDSRESHWWNFMDCVRTRRRPVSDIETAVRSTATELALLNSHSPWNLEASS